MKRERKIWQSQEEYFAFFFELIFSPLSLNFIFRSIHVREASHNFFVAPLIQREIGLFNFVTLYKKSKATISNSWRVSDDKDNHDKWDCQGFGTYLHVVSHDLASAGVEDSVAVTRVVDGASVRSTKAQSNHVILNIFSNLRQVSRKF